MCSEPADLFVRILPPVPVDLAPALVLCHDHALTYTAALWTHYRADASVTPA